MEKSIKALDLSTAETQIVYSKYGKTATEYKVVAKVIDLEALRREKEGLEEQLAEKEPNDKELIAWGKAEHPFYQNKEWVQRRIDNLNEILK